MVEKQPKENRPISQMAAAAFDERQKRIAADQADEQSKSAAIKEVSKAARDMGGSVESGLINTGKKEKKSGSW